MSLLMHEIDGRVGEDILTRVKRKRRFFRRLTYKASSAYTEMFWCGELLL